MKKIDSKSLLIGLLLGLCVFITVAAEWPPKHRTSAKLQAEAEAARPSNTTYYGPNLQGEVGRYQLAVADGPGGSAFVGRIDTRTGAIELWQQLAYFPDSERIIPYKKDAVMLSGPNVENH